MSSPSLQREGIGQGTVKAGHYLWIVLSLTLGVTLVDALTAQGIPVLYPFIQNEFGLSRAQVGLITSAHAIGNTATVALAGWLIDSLGVKRMVIISLLSVTAFTVAFPLVYSFPVILALAALIGIATSPGYPATTRAIMDWLPGRIRGFAMSFNRTGVPIGGALTAAVLPVLTVAIGWRMAAAVTSILVLIVGIVFLLMYRDAPQSTEVVHKSNLSTLQTILRNRGLVVTLIWGGTFVGLQFTVLSYFMLFLIEELRFSAIMAGGLLAIAQVSSGITRVLWGAASDFIFKGRRTVVLAITGFLTVVWLLASSLLSVGVPMTAVFLIAIAIGISTISFHGVFTALIGELADARQVGVTVGVAGMTMNAGKMIISPLFGYLVDMSGSYSVGWGAAAAMALVSTLALLTFGREPRRRQLSGTTYR